MSYGSKNIALIGAGYWGKNLIRVFNQLNVLKIICDLDKKVLEKRKKEYPNLEVTTDFSKILENRDIKAVVVATPAATHYNLIKRSLQAGKDVFVEKPLALKVKRGRELVELAGKGGRILMVGHLLLYHPAIVKLKELIERGELGKILYISSNRLNFGKLRREENVLWSFAPHDISVIIDILGMPEKVSATGKSYLQKDIADVTLSNLKFEGDQFAYIFVSWLNPFKEQKLSIIGSKRMAVFDGVESKLILYSHRVEQGENNSFEAVKTEGKIIKVSQKEPLMEEAEHFLKSIKERKSPRTDGKEALDVLEILKDCQKSINQNGKEILVT